MKSARKIVEMIECTRSGEFSILTLNRPDVLNALCFELLDSLESQLDAVSRSDARCLIVTGAGGKAFSAGADIKELVGRSVREELDGTRKGQRVLSKLEALRQPSIALVDGYALGGGCELSLACTFRLATPGAKFGLPEVKLGLVPGYGGTQRLPRLVGVPLALEVMLSGRFIGAEEALRAGLVSRIVDPEGGLEAAMEFGRTFCANSLMATGFIRDAVRLGGQMPLQDGLEVEAQLSSLSYRTEDGREGLQAFIDKRRPSVTDR